MLLDKGAGPAAAGTEDLFCRIDKSPCSLEANFPFYQEGLLRELFVDFEIV